MTDSSTTQKVAFDRRFLEKSREWFADAELRELTATPPINELKQEQWFASLPQPGYFLWGVLHEGNPAGVFGIKNVTEEAGEYWGYIGEKRLWGAGIGRWMMQTALTEARNMGLRRMHLRVLPANTRAIMLYHKFHFRELPTQIADGFLHMEVELSHTAL